MRTEDAKSFFKKMVVLFIISLMNILVFLISHLFNIGNFNEVLITQ